jgi:hypothetical protein
MKDTTAKTRKTTNRIFATPTNELAIPANPKMAAAKATTKQITANCNMVLPSVNLRLDLHSIDASKKTTFSSWC